MGRSRSRSRSPGKRRERDYDDRSRKKKTYYHSSYQKYNRVEEGDYNDSSTATASSSSRHKRNQEEKEDSYDPKRIKYEKEEDEEFDIRNVKSFFDKMFFREKDIIKKGTQQYEDFWKFYNKIQTIQRNVGKKKLNNSFEDVEKISISGIQVPKIYSKKFTITFSLKYNKVEDYILNLNPVDQEYVRDMIPKKAISDFLQTLLLFLDFLQKERFTKMKKLRETQSSLPIYNHREEIISILEKSNVLIIAGDTGCGKSTQIPQYLLKAGYTKIACTQPRRIACISLCKRVAYETLNEYGSAIGYQIRFDKSKTQHTKIIFLTEGLLLRQVSTDSLLTNYNVIVLDEVHERHLHGDFLLGIVKCLLYQRTDVKVILMSATINTELFQNYFQGLAPIVQVPGRLYPIKIHYRPVSIEDLNTRSSQLNPAPYVRILQLIDDKFPVDERGDVLMFLSGLKEITTIVEACQLYAEQTKKWIILPLHSSLSIDDQDKAFDYPPNQIRKCIVATNIAETSITIDGIRFVVDSGKVKEMAYDPTCKLQRLKEFWISKASAEQRKGRAGRTGPGVCYRLFSQNEYEEMQSYSTPEIQRVPLDSLLLQMISIGIPDCRKFPFIEPPAIESIESSILRLKEQEALTDSEELTSIGKTLSQLPVDVTIGKVLIMGLVFDQIESVLSLASALSVQSPFTNWAHRDQDCVAARKSLDSDHGDPLTLLNSYKAWLEEKSDPNSRTKQWCKRRGFEEQRFFEMTKLRQQFKSLLIDSGLMDDSSAGSIKSSSERAMRHGELKQLRSIKREFHQKAPRKKKFLKLNDYEFEQEGVEDEEDIDIKDVEFRMRNDFRQVKDLIMKSSPSSQDLMLLKVILGSGIYPQIAIGDDFNRFKTDQMYHTKEKGFTVLHPMGIFSNQPEVLALNQSDIILVPHMNTKQIISSKHQLLCFLNLLETNKPYLMNTFRMPAIQTLLLFSHSIDTDLQMTRFIFDSWLEVEFACSATARLMLITSLELRDNWSLLLSERLSQEKGGVGLSKLHLQKSKDLSRGLIHFLRSEAFYTIRRLLNADQKNLYSCQIQLNVPCDEESGKENCPSLQTGWKYSHNLNKGGINLTSFLCYGCLAGGEDEIEEWTCPICELCIENGKPLELLFHQVNCKREKQKEQEANEQAEEDDLRKKPFAKIYFCKDCQKDLHLTSLEILRHKRSHTSPS